MHAHLPPDPALRVKALESLLVEKGLLNSATVDRWIEVFSEEVGPKNGARVVARAWTDPAFKARLLASPTDAITEIGKARAARDPANGTTYYNHVVAALEQLMDKSGHLPPDLLAKRKRQWEDAYRRTPHGQAVRLHALEG
ncbi:MAG: nitrile hydratase subunit alpha [Thiohalocapsa sp.]|uniref:nitrile hydratase subunit alpha n=1 Tax=Thiohalocapsa sp. TaxID=2497641 RepID=UPI0025DB1222|nr:nitrile hydratase subunit alpha [Thiohalocapsa sp.]MCG6941409.1 nitrile hydratase subunit alpha [Thiohalocapsa sp.]